LTVIVSLVVLVPPIVAVLREFWLMDRATVSVADDVRVPQRLDCTAFNFGSVEKNGFILNFA